VLARGLAERCRTLAIAGALGARPRQLAPFVGVPWAYLVLMAAIGLAAVAAAGGAVRAAWRAPIRGLRELT
jgi:hypothetical protein